MKKLIAAALLLLVSCAPAMQSVPNEEAITLQVDNLYWGTVKIYSLQPNNHSRYVGSINTMNMNRKIKHYIADESTITFGFEGLGSPYEQGFVGPMKVSPGDTVVIKIGNKLFTTQAYVK